MGDALKALPDEASVREDVARWAPTEALALRFEQQPHEARIEYLQRVMGTHLYGNGMTFESREEAETVLVALERYELSYRKFLDQLLPDTVVGHQTTRDRVTILDQATSHQGIKL